MQNALVAKILEGPDAGHLINYLQTAWKDERVRRIKFREWITEEVKAEFINGEIVTHSPVMKRHWKANGMLSRLLSIYVSTKKMGEVGVEKVMISLTRNDYEPDLVYFSNKKAALFTEKQVIFPAPDFVVEILSDSTAKIDKTTKKEDYALHGISEYWIIDADKQRIYQHILLAGEIKYFPAKTFQSGDFIKSHAIEGFDIPVKAIFDEAINLKTLQDLIKK